MGPCLNMRIWLYFTCFLMLAHPLQAKFKGELAVSDKDLPNQPMPPQPGSIPPPSQDPTPEQKPDSRDAALPRKNKNLNQIQELQQMGQDQIDNDPNQKNRAGHGTSLNKLSEDQEEQELEKEAPDVYEEDTSEDLNKDSEPSAADLAPDDLNKEEEPSNYKDRDQPYESEKAQPTLKTHKKPPAQQKITPPPQLAVEPSGVILKETKGLVLFGSPQDYEKIDASKLKGLHIVDVRIPGDRKEFERRLNEIYLGKPLTVSMIETVISEIEDYYRENNRPLVKVIIPKQSIEGGVLCLIVAEASVGKIQSTGNKWLKDSRLREYVELQPGDPIDERTVRSSLDFINRNPFRTAEVMYKEGDKYQTTDLEFMVYEKRPFRVFLGTDNMGLSSIGRTRVFGGFNYGNFLGLDQILSYQFTASADFSSYLSNTASWIIPLPWKNVLEFFGGYSTVHADMPLPFSKSHGFSLQASTRYTIPFKVFAKEIAQEINFGADFKRMNNTLEFVEDFPVVGQYVNLSQLALSYKIALNYGFSKTTIELDGFWSPGQIFGDQSKERYNSLRYGATPKYVYGRGQIKEQLFFQKTGEFTMRAAGQLSSATLIPSEEFGLGGLETVRGYEERTINGDNALLLSLEVKTPAIRGIFTPHKARNGMVIEDKWQLVFFSDYGTALTKSTNVNYTSSNTTVVEPKRLYIAGAGPGLRYQIADYLYARADLGFKLKKDPALYGGGWAMVHFMVIANF